MNPATFWNNIYKKQPHIWGNTPTALVEFLTERLAQGQSVLDLGCGTGRDCLYLGHAGIYTVGVDLSNEAIRNAMQRSKEEGITTANYICGDYTSFLSDCTSQKFDAVLAINSLNHACEHISMVLNHVQRVLRSKGYLCLSLFASDDEEWIHHQQIGQRAYAGPFGQIQLYTAHEVKQNLYDFNILRFWSVSYVDNPHPGSPYTHRNSFWRVIAQLK